MSNIDYGNSTTVAPVAKAPPPINYGASTTTPPSASLNQPYNDATATPAQRSAHYSAGTGGPSPALTAPDPVVVAKVLAAGPPDPKTAGPNAIAAYNSAVAISKANLTRQMGDLSGGGLVTSWLANSAKVGGTPPVPPPKPAISPLVSSWLSSAAKLPAVMPQSHVPVVKVAPPPPRVNIGGSSASNIFGRGSVSTPAQEEMGQNRAGVVDPDAIYGGSMEAKAPAMNRLLEGMAVTAPLALIPGAGAAIGAEAAGALLPEGAGLAANLLAKVPAGLIGATAASAAQHGAINALSPALGQNLDAATSALREQSPVLSTLLNAVGMRASLGAGEPTLASIPGRVVGGASMVGLGAAQRYLQGGKTTPIDAALDFGTGFYFGGDPTEGVRRAVSPIEALAGKLPGRGAPPTAEPAPLPSWTGLPGARQGVTGDQSVDSYVASRPAATRPYAAAVADAVRNPDTVPMPEPADHGVPVAQAHQIFTNVLTRHTAELAQGRSPGQPNVPVAPPLVPAEPPLNPATLPAGTPGETAAANVPVPPVEPQNPTPVGATGATGPRNLSPLLTEEEGAAPPSYDMDAANHPAPKLWDPKSASIADEIRAIAEDSGYGEHGLRVHDEESPVGGTLGASRVWDDGEPTDDYLNGASAVDLRNAHGEDHPESAMRAVKPYIGRYVSLIGSHDTSYGEDAREIIMQNPEVLAQWDRGSSKTDHDFSRQSPQPTAAPAPTPQAEPPAPAETPAPPDSLSVTPVEEQARDTVAEALGAKGLRPVRNNAELQAALVATGRFTPEEAAAHGQVIGQLAHRWGIDTGLDPNLYYQHMAGGIGGGESPGVDAQGKPLPQVNATATFPNPVGTPVRDFTRAAIRFFQGANASTPVHEIVGHITRRALYHEVNFTDSTRFGKDDLLNLERHYGVKRNASNPDGSVWSTTAEERYARDAERYIASGKAPTLRLQPVFDAFKGWMQKAYDGIKGNRNPKDTTGSPLTAPLHPAISEVFDRLLAGDKNDPRFNVSDGTPPEGTGTAESPSATPVLADTRSGGAETPAPTASATGSARGTTAPRSDADYAGSKNLNYSALDEAAKADARARGTSAEAGDVGARTDAEIMAGVKRAGIQISDLRGVKPGTPLYRDGKQIEPVVVTKSADLMHDYYEQRATDLRQLIDRQQQGGGDTTGSAARALDVLRAEQEQASRDAQTALDHAQHGGTAAGVALRAEKMASLPAFQPGEAAGVNPGDILKPDAKLPRVPKAADVTGPKNKGKFAKITVPRSRELVDTIRGHLLNQPVGEPPTEEGSALNQPSNEDRTDTPEFRRWSGGAPVVDWTVDKTDPTAPQRLAKAESDAYRAGQWLDSSGGRDNHIGYYDRSWAKWQGIAKDPANPTPQEVEDAEDRGIHVMRSPEEVAQQKQVAATEYDGYVAQKEAAEQQISEIKNGPIATGKPVVLHGFHGTPKGKFEAFSRRSQGTNTKAPSAREGIFISASPETAKSYSGYKKNATDLDLYASLKNPLVRNFEDKRYREVSYKSLIDQAKANGHDGVIFTNTRDPGEHMVTGKDYRDNVAVVFDPRQVKSATDNRGTFDPADRNILHQPSTEPTPLHGALAELGAAYIEAGARRFKDFREAMTGAIGEDATKNMNEGDFVSAYSNARSLIAEKVKQAGGTDLTSDHLADRLARQLTRQGATNFFNRVAQLPNGHDILDDFVNADPEHPVAAANLAKIVDIYRDELAGSKDGTTTRRIQRGTAMAELLDAVAQQKKAERVARIRAITVRAPKPPVDAFDADMASKYGGKKTAAIFNAALGPELTAKLKGGATEADLTDDENRQIVAAHETARGAMKAGRKAAAGPQSEGGQTVAGVVDAAQKAAGEARRAQAAADAAAKRAGRTAAPRPPTIPKVPTAEEMFNRRLNSAYGSKAVADGFRQDIGGIHGKLLAGTKLTDAETTTLLAAHDRAIAARDASPTSSAPNQAADAINTYQDIIAAGKKAKADAAKAAAGPPPKSPPTPVEQFNAALNGRYGKVGGEAFRDTASPDLLDRLAHHGSDGITEADHTDIVDAHTAALAAKPESVQGPPQNIGVKAIADVVPKAQRALLTPEQAFDRSLASRYGGKDGAEAWKAQVGPDVVAKLLRGEEPTADEAETMQAAHDSLATERTKTTPGHAQRLVSDVLASGRKEAAARAARGEEGAAAQADALEKSLRGRFKDATGAKAFRAAVGEDTFRRLAAGETLTPEERSTVGEETLNRTAPDFKAKVTSDFLAGGKAKPAPGNFDPARRVLGTALREAKDAQSRQAVASLKGHELARAHLMLLAPEADEPGGQAARDAYADQVTRDLAQIPQGDSKALGNYVSRRAASSLRNYIAYYKAGLLSGTSTYGKIGLSHLLAGGGEAAGRGVGGAFDAMQSKVFGSDRTRPGLDLGAELSALRQGGAKGLRESKGILREGEIGRTLAGDPGIRQFQQDFEGPGHLPGLHAEFSVPDSLGGSVLNPAVRANMRVHTAAYHVGLSIGAERAASEMFKVRAMNEATKHGLTGSDRADYIRTRVADLMDDAHNDNLSEADLKTITDRAKLWMFQNPNWLTAGREGFLNALDEGVQVKGHNITSPHPSVAKAARTAMDLSVPFLKVPSNVAGRTLEYGTGAVAAPLAVAHAKVTGRYEAMTPEQRIAFQGNMSDLFQRGVTGLGLTAAGYALTHAGVINAPNMSKGHHEYGSVNAFGRKFNISGVNPIAAPLLVGGAIHALVHGDHATAMDDLRALGPLIADQPLLRNTPGIEFLQSLLSAEPTDPTGKKAMAALSAAGATLLQPQQILREAAASADPTGNERQADNLFAAFENRIPGARNTLPVKYVGRPGAKMPVPEPAGLFHFLPSVPQK